MNKHILTPLFWVLFLIITPAMRVHAQPLSGYCGREVVYNNDSTNLTWLVDTTQRTLTISGVGRMYDYSLDTKGPWYVWRHKIDRVIIGNGVTVIGTYGMYDLLMDSVVWGNTVETIREHAFESCRNLRYAFFPNSLQEIHIYAFIYCSNLREIRTGDGLRLIDSYGFHNCYNLRVLRTGNELRTINYEAFSSCGNLRLIDFGNSPVNVGHWTFTYNRSLKTIRGTRIKTISSYAFYQCDSLQTLLLGDSITSIDYYAFYGCHSLRGIHFPATLSNLGVYSFAEACVLDTITVAPTNPVFNSANNCNAVMRTSDNTLMLGCRRTEIPSTTVSIGEGAFFGCIGLTSVSLPIGLMNIYNSAFLGCTGLTSLALPEGLAHIGSSAFSSCSQLQVVVLPNSVSSVDCEAFRYCSSLTQPIYNNTLFAQLHTSHRGAYTVPNGIQRICCGAFEDCKSLTSISMPNSVTNAGGWAFAHCDSLQAVTLSTNLTDLGSYAFYESRALPSIVIPNRVKSIGYETFSYCHSLQSVILSDSLTNIDSYAFTSCASLPSIVIPDPVTHIGREAFRSCTSLTSITFPANLTSLEGNVIDGCTNLKTIIWNVRQANQFSNDSWSHPFYYVRSQITSFAFGDSVRILPGNLCIDMNNLTSLSFGCNVDSIGQHVFDGCKRVKTVAWNARDCADPQHYYLAPFYDIRDSITSFTFGDSVRHIPAYLCHSMSGLHELHIPKNVSSIGDYAFRYLGVLDSISVDPANTHYDSRGGCNALMETGINLLMLGCYKTQIPSNTQGIDACAFRNVRNLPTVTLPPTVTFIGKEAFNGCKDLKNLTLSNNIDAINDYAFQDCDSLYSITLPDSLWFIGLRAFANCSHIGTVTLPEKVELMDQYVFSGCSSLRSITCNAPEPPVIQETTLTGTSCPIYVPCPSITAYRNAPVWQDFGTRISGLFFNTLTARPNDYSFGRVNIQQQPDCEHNAILEAEPILGYKFVSWQDTLGNVLSVNSQYEFYLDEDKTIIAEFVRDLDALDDVESQVRIWVNEHNVMLITELNTPARLYDLMGHEVDATIVEAGVETSLHAPASGMYVVVTDNDQQKVIVK